MIALVDALARALSASDVACEIPLPTDVRVRRSRFVPWLGGVLAGMRRPAAAVTLGRTILVHPTAHATARLLRHELAHVAQWRRHPVTFPIRYSWSHIRHGYEANPYEAEARGAEKAS